MPIMECLQGSGNLNLVPVDYEGYISPGLGIANCCLLFRREPGRFALDRHVRERQKGKGAARKHDRACREHPVLASTTSATSAKGFLAHDIETAFTAHQGILPCRSNCQSLRHCRSQRIC